MQIKISENIKKKNDNVLKVPIWHNKSIKINNKSFFYKEWFQKGVVVLNDMIKNSENVVFYRLYEFNQKFNMHTDFLTYQGVINAIKKTFSSDEISNRILNYPFIPKNLEIFVKHKQGASDFYKAQNTTVATGRKKWDDIFGFDNQKWRQKYIIPFISTRSTKLQWLQFRINQYILTTNSYLFKIGLVDTPYCHQCKTEIETIVHTLWDCENVQ